MQQSEPHKLKFLEPENLRHAAQGLTARLEGIPPEAFLAGSALAIGASLCLRIIGRRDDAHFVGQWAPTLLLIGIYTKTRNFSQDWKTSFEQTQSSEEKAVH